MIKLKPCPFCGGEAELFGIESNGIFYVECSNCDANNNFDTSEKAISAWNKRVINDDKTNLDSGM